MFKFKNFFMEVNVLCLASAKIRKAFIYGSVSPRSLIGSFLFFTSAPPRKETCLKFFKDSSADFFTLSVAPPQSEI
jgi:hypothetical protein